MDKLKHSDLLSLEQYAIERKIFKNETLQHKKPRKVDIGPNSTLYFEDYLTIKYQIQEMLRIEKIFTREEINAELAAYNPLIPDGHNLKATFMLEYTDASERAIALKKLVYIEDKVWMRIANNDKRFAYADEDMERGHAEKTSAVHFLRFELTPQDITELKNKASLSFGIDHPHYQHQQITSNDTRLSLLNDID